MPLRQGGEQDHIGLALGFPGAWAADPAAEESTTESTTESTVRAKAIGLIDK